MQAPLWIYHHCLKREKGKRGI